MKICLINNLYKPLARGGAERVTEILALGLKKSGHEVFVISTRPWFKKTDPAAEPAGYKVYRLKSLYGSLKYLPKPLRLLWHFWDLFNLPNYFAVKKILKRENCQLVITNNLMGLGLLAPLAVKKLKIKHVHLVHDIQLIHPSGLVYWGEEKLLNSLPASNYAGLCSRLIDSPDIVIFPSLWLRSLHLEKIFFIKSKRLILPNPVPDMKNKPAAPSGGGNFKFLFLGQIEAHKGVGLLLKAYKKITAGRAGLELIFAGAGSQLENLKQSAGTAPVKFLGWQNEAEINRLLNDCDCLVYPSICYENCPSAIQLAQAAGLPVLAADFGGISELIAKGAGLGFKPGDEADIEEKMRWAINNPSGLKALTEAGKEKAALSRVDNYLKELLSLLI